MAFKHIHANHYRVQNQNELNSALYDFMSEGEYTKKQIRNMVQTYPSKYPCDIYIYDQSFECSRIYVSSVNNKTKGFKMANKAKEADDEIKETEFGAWCKELDEVAVNHGYAQPGKSFIESTGVEAWAEYFKEGKTPNEAFELDVLNG